MGAADVRRWVVWLLSRYSEAYAYQQYRSLQQFFGWLAIEEDVPTPMAKLRPPKVAGLGATDLHRSDPARYRQPGHPGPPLGRPQAKASSQRDSAGRPCRGFRALLTRRATLTRNQIRFAGTSVTVAMLAEPTPAQQEAFDLIGAPTRSP